MLNEIIEFEEYTGDIFGAKKTESPRLMPELFTNVSKGENFVGLDRAFEIIARYELFETNGYAGLHKENERIEAVGRTKDALENWFCDWLKKYYETYIFDNPKTKEKMKEQPEKWEWENIKKVKRQQFQNELFPISLDRKEKGRKNTFRDITYEKIISNAVIKGPLREYVLLARYDWYYEVYKDGKKVATSTKKDPEKNKSLRKELDHILKGISAYLLAKEIDKKCTNAENRYQVISKTDIANWDQMKQIAKSEFFHKYTFRVKNKDIPIFIKDDSVSYVSKICVNEEFLKKYGFQIALKEEAQKTKKKEKNLTYYEDGGSLYFLKKEGEEKWTFHSSNS